MTYLGNGTWVISPTSYGYFGGSGGGWGGADGGDGGTSGSHQYDDIEADNIFRDTILPALPTPCVLHPPSADMNKVNGHAKGVEAALQQRSSLNIEFGSIIYHYDGDVAKTSLQTSNSSSSLSFGLDAIPPGARVLAIVHNHPAGSPGIAGLPSPDDRGMVNQMMGWVFSGKHFTVDPNMLMYIHDSATGKTYVYDSANITSQSVSCHI